MVSLDRFLSNCKVAHCQRVAEVMFNLAKYCCELEEDECKEMYALGLVHDVGYLNVKDFSDHPFNGASMLPGYRYSAEILYHGDPSHAEDSIYIKLLNFADMHVDTEGNVVPMSVRLDDIGDRYGIDSREYERCRDIVKVHYDDLWFLYMEGMYFS